MDLTQAEGVAATIAAQSERELGAARQLLAGELARRLAPVMDTMARRWRWWRWGSIFRMRR